MPNKYPLYPQKNSLTNAYRIKHQKSIPLDLTQAVSTDIILIDPVDPSTRVFPFHLVIDKQRVAGNFGTDVQVQLRVGAPGAGTSTVVVAATAITDVQDDCQILVPPQTSFPVCTNGGQLFLRISTAGIGPLTTTRARLNNVATIGTASASLFFPGDIIRVANLGAGYDGLQTVLSSTGAGNTITFASNGADESTTADTNGTLALFHAIGHLVMLYF